MNKLELVKVLKKEDAVKKINNAIIVFYILMFLEGMLRKWVAPQLSSLFFFIKDPVLIYMYYICWRFRLFPQTVLFRVSSILAILYLFLSITQMLINVSSFVISIYGWRNYFMFMPLAFIMEKHMGKKELIRFAKITCYLGIPIAILTYIQYLNPPDAFINRNVGENSGAGFTVIGNIVRPYGPFSFVTGMAFYTPSLLAMLLFNFFLPNKDRFLSKSMFFICFCAFISNIAVSGSRGTFGIALIVIAFAFIGFLLLANNKKALQSLIIFLCGAIFAILIYVTVFSAEIDIMTQRFEQAGASEGSAVDRIATNFVSFEDISTELSFWGQGIGLGSSGGSFLQTGTVQFNIAESDWGKIVVECGVFFGFMYIGYRMILCLYMVTGAVKGTLKGINPIPMVLVGFELQTLLYGQMVSTGIHLAYGWAFLGISLAINKMYANNLELEERSLNSNNG